MSESHAAAYEAVRARVRAVVEAADPAALDRVVPATPAWRGRDVLAHMVGVTDDVVHNRLEGIASDAWTQAQVDARREVAPARMLDEWDEHAARFAELLAAAPAEIAGQALFDAATHEHDLRNAFGAAGARDSDAVRCGWDWILDARTRGGAPEICFATEEGEQLSGSGERAARVAATRFELFRAVSGRRTEAEIRLYGWDRDPDPALLLGAAIFSFAPASLGE